jgi:hypothetical protein
MDSYVFNNVNSHRLMKVNFCIATIIIADIIPDIIPDIISQYLQCLSLSWRQR